MAIHESLRSLSIFSSDNGMGHITRCVYLANIISPKFNITLFVNKKKIKNLKISKNIKIIDFKVGSVNFKKYDYNWYKKYTLKKFDIILSDNLPEVIFLNSNKTIIYANFFWNDILKKNKKNHFKKINELLIRKKITIFGNYLFQDINKRFNLKKIGFIGKTQISKFHQEKNILISLGTANIKNYIRKDIIKELIKFFSKNKKLKANFFLDSTYYRALRKNNFKNLFLARYEKNYFKKYSLAIIKPGFGVINDCLRFKIPIISVRYDFNKEFKFNLYSLKKNSLCVKNNKISKINLMKFDFKELHKKMSKKYEKLKWNGERSIYNILK